jgi:hypothetical protein
MVDIRSSRLLDHMFGPAATAGPSFFFEQPSNAAFSSIDKLQENFVRAIAQAGAFEGIMYSLNETILIVRRFPW